MPGVPFQVIPRELVFYELLDRAADGVVAGAHELATLLSDLAGAPAHAERIQELEHAGDDLTHEIIATLNTTFVTPFDRADMHGLAVALDSCVGLIEAAVDLIVLYRVDEVLPRVVKQVEVISRMAEITADAMPRLRAMKDLTAYWVEVDRLENRANKAYRRMLAELFNAPGADPITVMKHKDIIDALEAAANGFEQVAVKLEAIAVRES